jgi:hypothetical protein
MTATPKQASPTRRRRVLDKFIDSIMHILLKLQASVSLCLGC